MRSLFSVLGAQVRKGLFEVQYGTALTVRAFGAVFSGGAVRRRDIIEQMDVLGAGSLGIVALTGLFAGMAMGMQFSIELGVFGAKDYLGRMVTVSIIREMGPVLTALMVAGRVCSGIASELGGMKIGRQVDALRVMGIDPVSKLVMPRIVAVLVMLPILTIIADTLAILGGWGVGTTVGHLSFDTYWASVDRGLTVQNLLGGVIKPMVFGVIIGAVGCTSGLLSAGGARGVGRATTEAVVKASILILIANFVVGYVVIKALGWA
ncbi:MAG: ABC transporter permease [Nitrospirae bacterium]|nr:ABC transporter permease [Nitrospirota bacterium]